MRAVVLGASGFLGTAISADLDSSGVDVIPLARRPRGASAGVDLGDRTVVWADVLDGADVVINAAGKAHDLRRTSGEQRSEYWAVNASGAARAASGSATIGAARFIHLSTIKVLGDSPADGMRYRESDPLRPSGVYAESKADGERLVREALEESGTECVILRLPLVFGVPFKGNLAVLERAIVQGLPLPLSDPRIGKRTYVQMHDLLAIMRKLVTHPGRVPPVLHARSEPDLSAAEVAEMVGEVVGRPPRLFSVQPKFIRRIAWLVGRPEYAAKFCDEMRVSDEVTRAALRRLGA